MKKIFSMKTLLALAAVLVGGLSATATKTYVRVTDASMLGDGGKYAFVTAHNSYGSICFELNASDAVVFTPKDDFTSFTDAQLWTLSRPIGLTCYIPDYPTIDTHRRENDVFALTNGGKAITFPFSQGGTTMATNANFATAPILQNYIEIGKSGANATTFGDVFYIHYRSGTTTHYDKQVGIAVNPPSSAFLGKFSFTSGTGQVVSGAYTLIFKLFLEIDSEHPEVAAQALWDAKRSATDSEVAARVQFPTTGVTWPTDITALKTKVIEEWDKAVAAYSTANELRLKLITSNVYLQDGGQYAIANIGHTPGLMGRSLFLRAGATAPDMIVEDPRSIVSNDYVWTLEKENTISCGSTNANHIKINDKVFYLKNGNNYAAHSSGTNPRGVLSYTTTKNIGTNVFEFFDYPDNNLFPGKYYFGLHANYLNGVFIRQSANGANANGTRIAGSFDQNNAAATVYHLDNYGNYSSCFQAYLVIDPANLDAAARVLWNVYLQDAHNWAASLSEDIAATFDANAPAFPTGRTWTRDNIENEVNAAAEIACRPAMAKALDGAYIYFKNVGNPVYIVPNTDPANQFAFNTQEAKGLGITLHKNAAGDALTMQYGDTDTYFGNMPAADQFFTTATAANAGQYVIDVQPGGTQVWVRQYGADAASQRHMHVNYNTSHGLKAANSGATGPFSSWTVTIADPIDDFNAYREKILSQIQLISGSTVLWSTDDFTNAISAITDITPSVADGATKSEVKAEADRCSALVFAQVNALRAVVENKPLFIKYSDKFVYAEAGAAAATGLSRAYNLQTNSIWKIHFEGDGLYFKLKNDYQTNRYIFVNGGNAASTNDATDNTAVMRFVANGTELAINPVNYSTEQYLSATGTSGMTYSTTITSAGLYLTPEELVTALQEGFNPVNYSRSADTTDEFTFLHRGKGSEDMREASAALTADDVAEDAFLTTFNSLLTVWNNINNPLWFYPQGQLITIAPAATNPANGSFEFFYSTEKANSNKNVVMNPANAKDGDELFFYKDEELLSVSSGFYAYHGGSNEQLNFCSSAAANTPAKLKVLENGTDNTKYQLFMANQSGVYKICLHSHAGNETTWPYMLNKCGNTTYPTVNTSHTNHDWMITLVDKVKVSPSLGEWGSYHYPVATTIPAVDGVKFYLAYEEDGEFKLEALEANASVPAKSIVMFNAGTRTEPIEIPVDYTNTAEATQSSMIHATHIATANTAEDGVAHYYLGVSEGGNPAATYASRAADVTLTLHKVPENVATLPLNQVLVTVPTTHDDVQSDGNEDTFTLNVTKATTGIATIEVPAAPAAIYDLQGRRLSATTRGINIINGRKVRL